MRLARACGGPRTAKARAFRQGRFQDIDAWVLLVGDVTFVEAREATFLWAWCPTANERGPPQ
eukprot:9129265-Lingulodinium_polyedra.AAC.1